METFKKLMAFPLYATAAYLIWVLGGLTEPLSHLFGMVSLCFIALGAFVYGHWCAPHKPAATRRKGIAATVILAGLALFMGWPERPGKLWEHWTKAVEREQRADHAVYVDFTARWCATCQSNKAFAYGEEVKRVAKQKGIVFLKADWTNYDPEITKELSRLGESAIPVNVLYVPGQDSPFVFGKLLTPGTLLEQFNKLPDAKGEAKK
jgi:thiol:disulfide interchange protein DsbD